jgi:hypothetical protein
MNILPEPFKALIELTKNLPPLTGTPSQVDAAIDCRSIQVPYLLEILHLTKSKVPDAKFDAAEVERKKTRIYTKLTKLLTTTDAMFWLGIEASGVRMDNAWFAQLFKAENDAMSKAAATTPAPIIPTVIPSPVVTSEPVPAPIVATPIVEPLILPINGIPCEGTLTVNLIPTNPKPVVVPLPPVIVDDMFIVRPKPKKGKG